jgi:hypothetical protein
MDAFNTVFGTPTQEFEVYPISGTIIFWKSFL